MENKMSKTAMQVIQEGAQAHQDAKKAAEEALAEQIERERKLREDRRREAEQRAFQVLFGTRLPLWPGAPSLIYEWDWYVLSDTSEETLLLVVRKLNFDIQSKFVDGKPVHHINTDKFKMLFAVYVPIPETLLRFCSSGTSEGGLSFASTTTVIGFNMPAADETILPKVHADLWTMIRAIRERIAVAQNMQRIDMEEAEVAPFEMEEPYTPDDVEEDDPEMPARMSWLRNAVIRVAVWVLRKANA